MASGGFALYLRQQGYAQRTVSQYAARIERMDVWLAGAGLPSAGKGDAHGWSAYAETLPYSHSTRCGLRSALVAYWRFLRKRDCPAWAIPSPRQPPGRCKALEDEQIANLLVSSLSDPVDRAIVACLYYLGLRREEVACLRWDHLDRDARTATITGKGRRTRYLPVRQEVWDALDALPDHHRASEWVFPGRYPHTHMSPATINLHIRILGASVGLPKLHPHLFRHTTLAKINDTTGDLRAAQEFAGHADPRTTAIYTRATQARLWEAADAL